VSVIIVNGGNSLRGTIDIQGSKNSALPIFAACLVARGVTEIRNCPKITDIDCAIRILNHLGCKTTETEDAVIIDSTYITNNDIPIELMLEMRSSVVFLGSLLGRCGEAIISKPGGCELGARPIDLHISALREMGAEIEEIGDYLRCTAKSLTGKRITLRSPSVGATENIMLAACFAKGTTVISNAALEPEIEDLQAFLQKAGISVFGAGTHTIVIEGKIIATDVKHNVIPDRIVASTYLLAAAATKGEITINRVIPRHLAAVTTALSKTGCTISAYTDSIYIKAPEIIRATPPIATEPYPGFPTDAQPQFMAAVLKASGTTSFIENIFDSRYRHVSEFLRLGADIKIEGRVALVTGVGRLVGARLKSPDLRGGAALVIAALSAEGRSTITDVHLIDRGYQSIDNDLKILGANIERL